jgi:hypothetical protein
MVDLSSMAEIIMGDLGCVCVVGACYEVIFGGEGGCCCTDN